MNTAKEILDANIDKYFAMVPPVDRSDFARKLPVPAYEVSLLAMEEYASQQVQEMKEENDKLRNTGALLGEAYYRITEERDKAAQLLLSAYRLVCMANEFMYTDATSISDATSRDLYHFVGNEGPETEGMLLQLGLITEDQMTKNQNLLP
jgi:hypothetical protein